MEPWNIWDKILVVGVTVLALLGFTWVVRIGLPTLRAQSVKSYRVIDENKGANIERELNDIVRSDPSCRPILALAQSEYGTSKVILECGN